MSVLPWLFISRPSLMVFISICVFHPAIFIGYSPVEAVMLYGQRHFLSPGAFGAADLSFTFPPSSFGTTPGLSFGPISIRMQLHVLPSRQMPSPAVARWHQPALKVGILTAQQPSSPCPANNFISPQCSAVSIRIFGAQSRLYLRVKGRRRLFSGASMQWIDIAQLRFRGFVHNGQMNSTVLNRSCAGRRCANISTGIWDAGPIPKKEYRRFPPTLWCRYRYLILGKIYRFQDFALTPQLLPSISLTGADRQSSGG